MLSVSISARTATAVLVLAFVGMVPLGAAAQSLVAGTWTGTIEPPNGEYLDVSYEVRVESDTLRIRIVVPNIGEIEATDVHFEEEELHFDWYPGAPLACVLKGRDDGHYRGSCADPDGDLGYLTMVPPGKE